MKGKWIQEVAGAQSDELLSLVIVPHQHHRDLECGNGLRGSDHVACGP